MLLAERAIEIVADRGLNVRADAGQWSRMVHGLRDAFSAGQYEQGLNQAIDTVDELLTRHFALQPGEANPNELPDAPLVG